MCLGIDQEGVANPVKAHQEKPEALEPPDPPGRPQFPRRGRGSIEQQQQPGIGKQQQGKQPIGLKRQRTGGAQTHRKARAPNTPQVDRHRGQPVGQSEVGAATSTGGGDSGLGQQADPQPLGVPRIGLQNLEFHPCV